MAQLTKEHIQQLVYNFYQKVQEDDVLGPIFNDVAQVVERQLRLPVGDNYDCRF
jgi:truncated hemoglobin YjbI